MNPFNKHTISILSLFISTFYALHSNAQLFPSAQNPLSVKWRKIDSGGFRIIYPVELETNAQRMATTLPAIYPSIAAGYRLKGTRIPILLQNRGVIANGFVQLGPRKSEFFTTPPQAFDSQDWLNNLAVHELRHIAQFDKLTDSQRKPFPEMIYFAWFGLSIPTWFFEGDAVVNETALTMSGRGRQPSWIMAWRANVLEGKRYSYSKAYFGSNRDVTPGYYQLGYVLMADLRNQSGQFFSDSLLADIKERPFRPYPFSQSLKKLTGQTTRRHFLASQERAAAQWSSQAAATPVENYPELQRRPRFATDYHLPVRLPSGEVLALKSSKAEPPHFVVIDSNKNEKRLVGIGRQELPWFSYAAGKIVWDEIREDPRYKQRTYSVICSYDFSTKKTQKISSRSRLFSPSFSADGKQIVAVSVDLKNEFKLVVLDGINGGVLKTFQNPENHILQTPAFDQSGRRIAYIAVSEKGKAIFEVNSRNETKQLTPFERQQLGRPVYVGENIAFNAHYSGVDNIYMLDIKSKEISALTASKYGAFNPSPAGGNLLVFNNYTATGMTIAETKFDPAAVPQSNFPFFAAAATAQEATGNIFEEPVTQEPRTSSKYSRFADLLNFHSIVPIVDDRNTAGLELQSDNLLNTFSVYSAAKYHSDLKRFEYTADIYYRALYPVISVLYRNRPRRTFYSNRGVMQQGDWRENYVKLSASLPLSVNAGNHNYSFSAQAGTSYTERYAFQNLPASFASSQQFPLEYAFSFSHQVRRAERDIAPKFAQIVRFGYDHQPFDKALPGHILSLESFFYFPGLLKNHSTLASFSYQQAEGANRFAVGIPTVYGYNNIRARSTLQNTLLLNYRFPIAFPDWEIGPLAYIRNIRGGLFSHYENIAKDTNLSEPKTFGFELMSSMNLLRYQPVIDLGARAVFVNRIYNQKPILEFSFNYSF
ncbi:hypothetical protein [Pedobacter sp. SYP-B3415]|uniref:TolB family protein n=1 Tax=Pedobacter sp. SYP-B3415 TaxID=2496641 RepID=UPI00101CED23|nr:hypothetical protein [Pedobacter sp. SYP-B3415]